MKSIIVLIAILSIATSSGAQPTSSTNIFSFDPWAGTAYDTNCFRQYDNTFVTLNLYLESPVNPDFGDGTVRAVTNVGGFECKVTGTEGVNILGWRFPVPHINVGRPGELVVGYSVPVPVVDEYIMLASVDLYFGNITSFVLGEAPGDRCVNEDNAALNIGLTFQQSIAGSVAYVDFDDPSDPLVAGQAIPLQLAIYREQPVATDQQAWGTLKALFR